MTANSKTTSHNKQAKTEGQCCLKRGDLFTPDCGQESGITHNQNMKPKIETDDVCIVEREETCLLRSTTTATKQAQNLPRGSRPPPFTQHHNSEPLHKMGRHLRHSLNVLR